MKISCICTTFGRTKYLMQAVQCFNRQTYEDKQLIILNSCPRQKYIIDNNKFPNIKIINLDKRPQNYSKCFDLAVQNSDGQYIIVWDDDDLYMPQYINHYVNQIEERTQWVRQSGYFYTGVNINNNKFDHYKNGYCAHTIMYSRKIYDQIGGYEKNLKNGQSNAIDQIVTNLMSNFNGKIVKLDHNDTCFIYRFYGVPAHYSVYGEKTSYDTVGYKINKLIDSKHIPQGEIQIIPSWDHNYIEIKNNSSIYESIKNTSI